MPATAQTSLRVCNLYTMRRSAAEVARTFAVAAPLGANFAEEVYPGYPGLVVADGAVQVMTWGFPLALTGRKGRKLKPRPVTNARDDKLRSPFWQDSFARRRCLIPVSAWAEAEGEPRRMTRTWYGLPGKDPFAVAGLWRETAEWGPAFAMVMTDGCLQMAEAHDRMPVLLARDRWDIWLHAPPDQAQALCVTSPQPLSVERTGQPWAGTTPQPELF